ncbi:MAG: MNIO family bufferin maturase [Aeromonas sp.]|uniref:MNIO family bufferin maturase n=1 Tax=Aeromonas sp. TaxID=647 RepID=UPI003F3C223B
MHHFPWLGFGLGLRPPHFQDVLDGAKGVDWFEILSENFMVAGGKPRHYLDRVRADYPIVMHGVSMNIGSTDPLDMDYLARLRELMRSIEPVWLSDHLCWTGAGGQSSHDLLPLPLTDAVLTHLIDRIDGVQNYLGRPLVLENASTYLAFPGDEYLEQGFLNQLSRQSGCKLLLDINNIYVSSRNHGFDANAYLDEIDTQAVVQFHLAGHSDYGDYVIDTHDHPIVDPVWSLFERAVRRFGPVSTMIERDDHIPPFAELVAELNQARRIASPHWPTGKVHREVPHASAR